MTNIIHFLPLGQAEIAGDTKKVITESLGGGSDFLSGITDSMGPMLGEYLPKILGALVILVIGYIIARIMKAIITAVVGRTGIGAKLAPFLGGDGGGKGLATGLGTAAFWIVMLFVGIATLSALDLKQVSEPLTGLLNNFFEFIPNVIGAAILGGIAYLVATIAKIGSTRALEAADVDNRLKLQPGTLTNALPMAAFSFILLLFLPGVLDAVGIESLSGPVKGMVQQILDFIPTMLTAAIILAIFLFVAKLAGTLVSSLLSGVGFNDLPQKMGLVANSSQLPMPASDMAGKAAFGIIGLMGALQAVDLLKLETLSSFVNEAKDFIVPIVIGCAILGVGMWLANTAKRTILSSNMANSGMMANVAFGAITLLSAVVALKRTNLAGEIVDLGFGLALGGMALALALAFGLGGRDAAAKFLDKKVK